MAVYFVCRSPYQGPAGKCVRRLGCPSVLAWFQSIWHCAGGPHEDYHDGYEAAQRWLRDELDADVYGFSSLFAWDPGEELPYPESEEQLVDVLGHIYAENAVLCRPHCVQVSTNDDDLLLEYYIFDDEFLREHAPRAAWLLHDDWRLPTSSGAGGFVPAVSLPTLPGREGGAGATLLVLTNLAHPPDRLDAGRQALCLPGVRLPELPGFLCRSGPSPGWPTDLVLLWALLPGVPGGKHDLGQALREVARFPPFELPPLLAQAATLDRGGARKLVQEHQPELAEDSGYEHNLSRVQASEHVARLCWNAFSARLLSADRSIHFPWTLFDDVWASAHPDLADGLLRHPLRWDVLSDD
jgi:hypothetical protein